MMRIFIKSAFRYWLYNQWFSLASIIIILFAQLIGNYAAYKLRIYSNYNENIYIYGFFFIIQVICALVILYKASKLYWQNFLENYHSNHNILLITSCLPIILVSTGFTLCFYLSNGSINFLSYFLIPLGIIHISVFTYYFTLSNHLDYFLLILFLSNIIPLSLFTYYIYKIHNIKLTVLKSFAVILIYFTVCSFIINNISNNSNTIRSHNFAYENGLSSVDLEKYKITNVDNILPKLNEPTTLLLTQDEWLTLDGAEAAYPVYSAYANACYKDISNYQYSKYITSPKEKNEINAALKKYVAFNNTVYAFKDLINKRCDIFFGAMPSKQQQADAAALGEELVLTPIAQEAFVFFVNSNNHISSLTTQQIQDIYSGKTKNWQPLGGEDRRILAFQRPENSGSQTLLQHIMGNTPIMEPLKEEYIGGMGEIGTQVANYNGYAGALGFSFKFFLTGMLGREDAPVKMLAIDGVSPTDENIRSGKYPFTTKLYAITLKSNTKPQLTAFLNWMQSPQGQQLAEKVGYIRLN